MLSGILALLCLGAMPVLALVCLVIVRRMSKKNARDREGRKAKRNTSAMYTVVLVVGAVVVLTALAYSMAPHLGWVTAIFCILSMVLLLMAGRVARGCSKRCEKWGDQADGAIQRVARAVSHYFDELDQSGHDIFHHLRRAGGFMLRWLLVAIGVLVLLDLVIAPFGLVRPWLFDGWHVLLGFLNGASNATSNATSPTLVQNATNYVTKASPPHEVIRNIGLLFAGILGIVFTAWRAMAYDRQTVVAEEGLITDRFNKAAEQLGSEHVTVRIAAINALWRIGVDSKSQDDKRAVLDVLCGFVREYNPEQESGADAKPPQTHLGRVMHVQRRAASLPKREDTPPTCPPDVQTVLDFLGKRMDALRFKPWRMDYVVDLSGAYLAGCNVSRYCLRDFNLQSADLRNAQAFTVDLRDANLVDANVQGANLILSHLDRACLWGAHLDGTKLMGTFLDGAELRGAHLGKADLGAAGLKMADLHGAHLDGANLEGVHLDGANLRLARLDGANLEGSQLAGADLRGTHLNAAEISGATFKGVIHLTQAQINTACWDGEHPPTLPPGFTCPANYCEWDLAQRKVIPIDPPDPIAPCPAKEPDE